MDIPPDLKLTRSLSKPSWLRQFSSGGIYIVPPGDFRHFQMPPVKAMDGFLRLMLLTFVVAALHFGLPFSTPSLSAQELPKDFDPRVGDPELVHQPEGEPVPTEDQWAKAEAPITAPQLDITTEQVAVYIASKFGLPPNSKIVYRFHDLVVNYKKGTKIGKTKSRIKTKNKIYKHLRFGKGILFPSKDDLKPVEPTAAERQEILKSIAEGKEGLKQKFSKPEVGISAAQKRRDSQLRALATPRVLPACLEDKVERKKNKKKHSASIDTSANETGVIFDVLFLKEGAPNVKNFLTGPDELFGTSTKIEYYSQIPGETPSLVASIKEINCLPFRLRVTEKYVERLYGEHALKNYDDKKKKKGFLHSTVQSKLQSFF